MKRLLILSIGVITLPACNSRQHAASESATILEQQQSIPDCSVAVEFINDYTEFCMIQSPTTKDSGWIAHNPLLTDDFKATYTKTLTDAYESDPEMGLDADPIFDAQDFPDKGFELVRCDSTTGYVTVGGRDWKAFNVVLKVVQRGDKWLVDGCGIINVPQDRRASR